jgi:hypothetical protein
MGRSLVGVAFGAHSTLFLSLDVGRKWDFDGEVAVCRPRNRSFLEKFRHVHP